MEATKLLKRDHDRVKMLLDRYDALGDRAMEKRQEIFDSLYAEVDVHSRVEEEIFYPAVKKVHSKELQDMVAESLEEHKVVKTLLDEIQALKPQDERFDAKFSVFKENLLHHAQEEEEGKMFPLVIEKISLDDRHELGKLMEARKDALQAGWVGAAAAWLRSLMPVTE